MNRLNLREYRESSTVPYMRGDEPTPTFALTVELERA
jgi:hypothetical protein